MSLSCLLNWLFIQTIMYENKTEQEILISRKYNSFYSNSKLLLVLLSNIMRLVNKKLVIL